MRGMGCAPCSYSCSCVRSALFSFCNSTNLFWRSSVSLPLEAATSVPLPATKAPVLSRAEPTESRELSKLSRLSLSSKKLGPSTGSHREPSVAVEFSLKMDDVSPTLCSRKDGAASEANDTRSSACRELLLFVLSLICRIPPGVSMAIAGGDALFAEAWPHPRDRLVVSSAGVFGDIRVAKAAFCLKRELL